MGTQEPAMYTAAEVATLLALSERTVYQFLADGIIPAVRFGRRWLVSRAWVDRVVAEADPGGRCARPRGARRRGSGACSVSAPRSPNGPRTTPAVDRPHLRRLDAFLARSENGAYG